MLLRSAHLLRGSVGGCSFGRSASKPVYRALSSLGLVSTTSPHVASVPCEDASCHNGSYGFRPIWATGLACTFAASVSACTDTVGDSDGDEGLVLLPAKLVQTNINSFFRPATPESLAAAAAAAAALKSSLPNIPKKRPHSSPKRGRPSNKLRSSAGQVQPAHHNILLVKPKRAPTNWWHPYLIKEILWAVDQGKGWQGTVDFLQEKHKTGLYVNLRESTVRGWYQRVSTGWQLTPGALEMLSKGSSFVRPSNTRPPALRAHPQVLDEILELLKALREGGAPINSVTGRCVALSVLELRCPELLVSGGGTFKACRSWMRDLFNVRLGWSQRVVTTEHQKLPSDWEIKVEDMHLRMAAAVMLHSIPKELVYSMDETFVFFVPMKGTRTYAEKGSKSVSVVGAEEKRGCTASITCKPTGAMVPFMAIFGGRSGLSEPGGVDTKGFCKCKEGAAIRKQAEDLNHRVTHSDSHWQTQDTFKQYITEIIVPDYTAVCKQQQRVLNVQRMILQLDVYAVHRAEDIIKWLKEFHPYIVLAFVPGGCTGAVQIPDTCLNRPFKAAIHESFSKWVVAYLSAQTRNGVLPADLKMDFKIGPVRNQSLLWMIKAQQQLCTMPASIVRAYEKAGTMKIFDPAYGRRALAETERLFGRNSAEAAFEQVMGLPDMTPEEDAAEKAAESIKHEAGLDAIDGEGGEDEATFSELLHLLADAPRGTQVPLQFESDNDLTVRGERAIPLSPSQIADYGQAHLGPMTATQIIAAARTAAPPRKLKNAPEIPPVRNLYIKNTSIQHPPALHPSPDLQQDIEEEQDVEVDWYAEYIEQFGTDVSTADATATDWSTDLPQSEVLTTLSPARVPQTARRVWLGLDDYMDDEEEEDSGYLVETLPISRDFPHHSATPLVTLTSPNKQTRAAATSVSQSVAVAVAVAVPQALAAFPQAQSIHLNNAAVKLAQVDIKAAEATASILTGSLPICKPASTNQPTVVSPKESGSMLLSKAVESGMPEAAKPRLKLKIKFPPACSTSQPTQQAAMTAGSSRSLLQLAQTSYAEPVWPVFAAPGCILPLSAAELILLLKPITSALQKPAAGKAASLVGSAPHVKTVSNSQQPLFPAYSEASYVVVKQEPSLPTATEGIHTEQGHTSYSSFAGDPDLLMYDPETAEDRAALRKQHVQEAALCSRTRYDHCSWLVTNRAWLLWKEAGFISEDAFWKWDTGQWLAFEMKRVYHWSYDEFDQWKKDECASRAGVIKRNR